MKKIWKITALVLGMSFFLSFTALADSSKVVTIGADLSQEQKDTMFKYFGVSKNAVDVIEVNNQQEREYLEGIASDEVIGTKTFSCSFIEPTASGGIQVKTANLTWVTSNMIASTLTTAGVTNCNVIAACPLEVSGTGALTGILKAYEKASDGTLNEEKKQLATDELIQTGELGDTIGKDKAVQLISGVKLEVIKGEVVDPLLIKGIVEDAAKEEGVQLSEEQVASLTALMEKIAAQKYDYDSLKETLDRVEQNVNDALQNAEEEQKSFFTKILDSIKNFFSNLFGNKQDEVQKETIASDSILNNTNDSILGDVVGDATNDQIAQGSEPTQDTQETNSIPAPDETNQISDNIPEATSEDMTGTEEKMSDITSNDTESKETAMQGDTAGNNTIDSNQTSDSAQSEGAESESTGFFDKLVAWFKGLFQ